MTVVVVGAGIVGLMNAYHLAEDGHQVIILESNEAVARKCSYANAGLVAVGHTEAWASPEAPMQMIKALLGKEPSLKVSKFLDKALWSWAISFLGQCRKSTHLKNSTNLFNLSAYSRNILLDLEDKLNLQYDQEHDGVYYLFKNDEQFKNRLESLKESQSYTDVLTPVSIQNLINKEKTFESFRTKLSGCLLSKVDSKGDCFSCANELFKILKTYKNVKFIFNCEVNSFNCEKGKITSLNTSTGIIDTDHIILATGINTPKLTKQFGIKPLIYPVKGYSATYPILDTTKVPSCSFIDETDLVAVSCLNQRLRVTAIAEFAGHDLSIPEKRKKHLDQYVNNHFPGLVDFDNAEYWAGLRPSTPSGLPYLGQFRNINNLWINAGHGQLGWTMSAGAGRIIADRINGDIPKINEYSSIASWLI